MLQTTLFVVAFEGELYEAVEEVLVGEAAGGPEPRVHAGGREAWDGVDLVQEQPVRVVLEEEVHTGHARGVYGLVDGASYAPELRGGLLWDAGGHDQLHTALDVLGLIVVELVLLDQDLSRHRDLGLLVAEHRDLYLPGVYAGLDNQPAVERGRLVQGTLQRRGVRGLADADAGAEVRGLDEARVPEGGFDAPHPILPVVLPVRAGEAEPFDLREAVVGEDLLHCELVHTHRA